MCTRTLYVGADNTVITGRNMDWSEDLASNLWVFPAGMRRDGAAGRTRRGVRGITVRVRPLTSSKRTR